MKLGQILRPLIYNKKPFTQKTDTENNTGRSKNPVDKAFQFIWRNEKTDFGFSGKQRGLHREKKWTFDKHWQNTNNFI